MINKTKLVNYMKYVLKNYPDGCAPYNWNRYYNAVLNGTRLPEEYEFGDIIEESLSEFHNDIGLCGCGRPEDTYEVIRRILNIKASEITYDERQKQFSELCNSDMDNENYSGLIQFVLYILDNKDFLEHGGSIGGAWLSEKGKIYLDLLNMLHEIENNEE